MEILIIVLIVTSIIIYFLSKNRKKNRKGNKKEIIIDKYQLLNKSSEEVSKEFQHKDVKIKDPINFENTSINDKEFKDKIAVAPVLKDNWSELKKIIDTNSIESLYHITDESNLESINKYNCLFSWEYAKKNNINICKPGGNELSRNLDKRYGVQNYVRLCFTTNLPMIHIAMKDGRIKHPVVLEFDPNIIYSQDTKFCPINATDNNAIIGDSIEIFQNIRFDLIKKNGFIEDNNLRKFKQAEVLVLEKLSLEYLKKKPYNWR